jgi:hypothetical protein
MQQFKIIKNAGYDCMVAIIVLPVFVKEMFSQGLPFRKPTGFVSQWLFERLWDI